jgi:enamine deaminase RidA (YjgF/YER057c/UK114 family)
VTIQRINPGAHWTQIVIHGDTVYLVGVTAQDRSLDVKGQTRQVLEQIDALLARAGTDKSKLLTATIWLTDIENWSQMNEVWDAWVVPGNAPARATVEAKLAQPGLLVEIMVQAAK